jgi:gamma-glutamyl:cysteine ligase YbdK (ATP-grasp superfamily)
MLNSKSIRSPKDLWWDIRPSPHYGTLEIRTCDIMPSVKDNVALAALIHAIAATQALLELLDSLSDTEIPDGAGFKPASEIYATDFQHFREIVDRGIASDRIKRVYNSTGRLEDTVRH